MDRGLGLGWVLCYSVVLLMDIGFFGIILIEGFTYGVVIGAYFMFYLLRISDLV